MKDKFSKFINLQGKYLTSLLILLAMSIGTVWGAVIDLTPSSDVSIANKKWKEVGGGYVSRNGSGTTVKTDGLITGGGNTYVVFNVSEASTIEAKFINVSTSGYSNKTVCCGKVSADQWTAITGAATNDTQYQLSIASGDKLTDGSITLPKSQKDATTSCSFTATTAGKYAVYWTSGINDNVRLYEIEITATGGGGDPVDPVFTYTASTYTIGDPALDLSTKLSSTNTTGAITFAVSSADAGTTGASIANSKNFSATTAGTATITVSQEASTGFNAKTQDITVTVVEPDPCSRYFWFAKAADATAAGKTNWDGFTITQSGSSNNTSGSKITIDGTDYAVSGRTSSNVTANIATFTVPANKAGKFYALLQSSGSTTRTIYLKQGDNTLQTLTDAVAAGNGNDAALSEVVIDNIPAGTYSVIANNNTRIGMLALKVCDATYHTISFDSDGGSSVASLSVLDGTPATKPADPTKANCDFVKWVVKSSGADYNWSANVTADIALKAIWSPWPTLTLKAGEGATGSDITSQHQAGSSVEVPAKPEGFSNGTKNFDGWTYSAAVTSIDETHFEMPASDLTLTAKWVSAASVARIGETEYATFAEALDHHADGTIVLLQNVELDAMLSVNYDLAIDLNGNTLSRDDASAKLIEVYGDATLTITGTAENSEFVGRINLGRATNSNGNLVINGGNYHVGNGQTVLHVNGTCLASNVTITNATFVSPNDNAIQLNGAGAFNISNSTFTGKTGIYLKAGVLTLTACTVNGTGAYTDYTFYQNGSNPTGDAIVVDACGYPGAAPTINIVSGTYNSEHGSALAYYHPQGDPAVGGVTGGTFNSEVPAALCAPNYVPKDNSDGTYGVKPLAQSIDLATYAQSHTGTAWQGYLTDNGYAYVVGSEAKAEISLDNSNAFDRGLKLKQSTTSNISFEVAAGKLITIVTGKVNGLSIAINDAAATAIAGGTDAEHLATSYYYNADAQKVVITETNTGYNIIREIKVENPYVVSFDPNGGDPVASQLFYGTALTLPTPTNGTYSFKGWYDAETEGNLIGAAGASYTPTANITLHAQWELVSTDNTLSDLKVGGVTVDGFSPAVHTYYVVLPYGTAVGDIPAISATANSAKAKQVAIEQAVWTGEPYNCYRAQANVQAEDESWGYYDVRFSFAPKDGVSIIKVATTGGTNKTVTGLYAGDGDVNLSSSKKMDKGKYIGFTLDGTTLQAGDRINVHTTQASSSGGSHIIFYDNMTDKNELYDTEEIGGTGDNIFTINAAMVGATTAYVYRASDNAPTNWNGYVDYIEVTRAMDPVLTAITLDGVAADKDSEFAFSATLPNGTNLASMTVVPTIVKNGEGGSAAPTAAWAWGNNTYRVTDKDGDYTDYTITLTEAATPSAAPEITAQPASANYYECASIAALEVTATGSGELSYQWYLGENAIDGATAATYTPTVSAIGSYVYHCVVTNLEAGHPATSLASDNATITIAEDPAAIKLLNGSTVNTTNFITGVTADETVEFMGNTVNYAKFAGTVSNVNGVKDLTRVIAYNATTNKTKIQISAHNNSTNARSILVKGLVEGADAAVDMATIALSNKEDKVSDWIEFDNAANRTIYIFVGSDAGDVYFTQVKVIESGETTLKMAGEAGYSLNFNQGRFFGVKDVTAHFEGMSVAVASSDCQPLNTSVVKLASTSMSFDVAAPVTLTVTTNNSNTYYVTKGTAGTDNETAYKGASDFDLTAGTWYITGGASNVEIKSIAFAAPKCAEPVIDAEPVSNTNVSVSDNLTASVTAHATDGATLAYQWYNADGDAEVSGATDATLTTTTPGTYYVIITASKAGYENRTAQSQNATLAYRDNTIATLSALTYGTPATAIVLEADKYNYRVTLDEGTTDVPTLTATATQAAYGATAVPTDATAFTDYKAVSTVLVTAEDGTTTQTYTVTFVVQHIYAVMEDVTESTTWNWTGVETADVDINDVANRGVILGNYISGDNFEMMEGKAGEKAFRNQQGGVYQGTYLHFNTTVPGRVKFYFRAPSSGETCTITVKNGGRTTIAGARGNSLGWSSEVFVNGDVVIEMENDKEGGGTTRVQQVVFTAAEADYTRDVTAGKYGTICLPNGGVMVGAALYEVAYFDASQKKIFFDEVLNGAMVAGTPYIFLPEENVTQLKVYYTDAANADAGNANGLFGSYTKEPLAQNAGNYILYNNQYLLVNSDNVYVGENRAYIKLGEISTNAVAPAPGRRRVAMGVLNEQVITGVEDLNVGDQPIKVMIDGQLFILRGEKMYDAQGRLVK